MLDAAIAGMGDATTSIRYQSEDRIDRVAGLIRVTGTDWYVIAAIPTQTITAGARKVVLLNMLAVGSALAIAIGAAALD